MRMSKKVKDFLILFCVSVLSVFIPALLILLGVLDDYGTQILSLAIVNSCLAISVNIISGITGQLSLGQAGFMAIGAYSCIYFCEFLSIPFGISVILAGLFTAFIGFLIGFPTLKLKGDYLAIVTLGFGEIIRVVLVNLKDITGGPNGKSFASPFSGSSLLTYIFLAVQLVVIIALVQNFIRSSYGRCILAVRDDEIAADSTGVSVFKYKMIGFIIASFIAGIGGTMYISLIGFIKPDNASFLRSIDYLIYVVLGGMGSTTGTVLAAFVLTILQEVLRFLEDFRLVFYPLILILVMLFRPQGLLGTREFSFTGFYERFFVTEKLYKKPLTWFKSLSVRKRDSGRK